MHVGVQRKQEVVELVPGDPRGARWTFEVTAKEVDGGLDFGGPFVHGKRGDRFVYLSWGVVDGDEFTMFRRAKLHFADVDASVLRSAVEGRTLRCRVVMIDERGNPRCTHVRAPDAVWSAT